MVESTKRDLNYWVSLDGLRALAVSLVVLHHLGQLNITRSDLSLTFNRVVDWGWIGVDLFFVLSGFLISSLLLREVSQSGKISIKDFYVRRAARIWPLYYLVIFAALVIAPFCGPNKPDFINWFAYFAKEAPPFIFFLGNFALLEYKPIYYTDILIGLRDNPLLSGMLAPLWSLAIEEQFYIVWPWLLSKAFGLKKMLVLTGAVAAFSILSLVICLFVLPKHSTEAYMHCYYYLNTPCRLLPLMVGAALAAINFFRPSILDSAVKKFGPLMLAASIATFLLLVYCFPPIQSISKIHTLTFTAIALGFGSLLTLTLKWDPLIKIFSNKFLVYIGKRSYAIYMFHTTCLWVPRQFILPLLQIKADSPMAWAVTAGIGVPLTLVCAELSWQFIEQHFEKLKKAYSQHTASIQQPPQKTQQSSVKDLEPIA